ncbi:hypothetical protein [Plantactinospora soyae]|uniref:Uncharacterized protein n=1 Tax=Plantactinospora soyae TaxID=1544732 RepID=A0A927R6Q1_9ACTN|nr:hypothetical protein [Plantactinospora soyae]MBE1487111.1 hypothetical protein [Plantactinospora soyae]
MPVNVPRPKDGSQVPPGASWGAGAVTRIGLPPTPPDPPPAPPGGTGGRDRRLWWFVGAAGSVLVIGLVVVLGLTVSDGVDPLWSRPDAATDVRPPLARRCPLPGSAVPGTPTPANPEPATPVVPPAGPGQPLRGGRTVDPDAGISYATYGAPWEPWRAVWSAGSLEVPYKVGQHFVTESAYDGFSDYHASILSAAVPAAENDALTFDIECVGRQVADDVRTEYYPQPNRMESIRNERATVGGRPAWVSVFRLHFSRPGLRATDELAAVACIDVGRSTAAILYISVPGTHRELDWVVEHALASVRPG